MKQMIILPIAICLIFVAVLVVYAAEVKNLTVKQTGNRMICEYDLMGDEGTAEVNVTITVKGQAYSSDKLHVEGDFGKVKPGNDKKIWWNVLQDFPRGVSDDVEWDVAAEQEKEKKTTTLVMGARPSISAANEIRRDGRLIAYDNGTVLDTKTNLMWAAKDNGSDINWPDAKSYCEKYRGGGYTDWRMPTRYELAGLYDSAKTYSACGAKVHLTELIRITCYILWASETHDSAAAFFYFGTGKRGWLVKSNTYLDRVLPVRSGK